MRERSSAPAVGQQALLVPGSLSEPRHRRESWPLARDLGSVAGRELVEQDRNRLPVADEVVDGEQQHVFRVAEGHEVDAHERAAVEGEGAGGELTQQVFSAFVSSGPGGVRHPVAARRDIQVCQRVRDGQALMIAEDRAQRLVPVDKGGHGAINGIGVQLPVDVHRPRMW